MPSLPTRVSPNVGSGRIVATDYGPHPPEVWGQIIAEDLTDTDMNMEPARQAAALRLRADMIEALTPLLTKVQAVEREKLQGNFAQIMKEADPSEHIDEIVAAIQAAAKGGPWEGHFGDAVRLISIRGLIGTHVATAQHIEKSWHADRNPDNEHAKAFRAQHHPVVPFAQTPEDLARALLESKANGG